MTVKLQRVSAVYAYVSVCFGPARSALLQMLTITVTEP